jgi:hypothetical protein
LDRTSLAGLQQRSRPNERSTCRGQDLCRRAKTTKHFNKTDILSVRCQCGHWRPPARSSHRKGDSDRPQGTRGRIILDAHSCLDTDDVGADFWKGLPPPFLWNGRVYGVEVRWLDNLLEVSYLPERVRPQCPIVNLAAITSLKSSPLKIVGRCALST